MKQTLGILGLSLLALKPVGAEVKPVRLPFDGDNLKPCVVMRPAGGVYIAWAQRKSERTRVMFSHTEGGTVFAKPAILSTPQMYLDLGAENAPDVAVGHKGEIYVTWVAGNSPAPPKKGEEKGHPARPANLSIWVARSDDDGAHFQPPVKVNDDGDGPEHRFPTVRVDAEGAVCMAWLDKRTQKSKGTVLTRVFTARSTDGGRTFSRNVDATMGQSNPICHCCRIGLAMDAAGGWVVAFRNDDNDLRDMMVTNSSDKGTTFSPPRPLESTGWHLPNCPMDGPSIALSSTGDLHAVFMTSGDVKQKPLWGTVEPKDAKVLYRSLSREGAETSEMLLGAGHHPRIAIDARDNVHLVWRDNGVHYVRFSGLPSSAHRSVKLSSEGVNGSYPTITTDTKGTAWCAWQQLMPDDSVQVMLTRLSPD